MAFLDFLFGKKAQIRQLPTFNPQQQQLQSQLLQYLMQQLSQGPQDFQQGFEPFENLARQNFEQRTVPSLAERFTSMGSGGQRSSAFQAALGQAGSGLESNLAALRSQYGLARQGQQQSQLANLLQLGLRPSVENIYNPRQPGLLENAAVPAFGALGMGLGGGFGMQLGNSLWGSNGTNNK